MIRVAESIEGTQLKYRKATPKEKARDLLHDALITKLDYWQGEDHTTEGMTEREKALVHEQMRKEVDRIIRKWGL